MLPSDFAHLIAHTAASEFLRLGVQQPDKECVGMTILEAAWLRVVVSLTKYEGPARLYPTPEAAAVLGVPAVPPLKMTGLMEDVMEAAPSRLHHPVSVKKLAALSGYSYNSHFRNAVNRLVDAGLLTKLTGGVRKL